MFYIFWIFKFILFNKKKYKKIKSDKIILIELFNYKASIISNGILANELAKFHNAKIVGYEPYFTNIKKRLKSLIDRFNLSSKYHLYSSYGLQSIIIPKTKPESIRVNKEYKNVIKKIKSKKDILKIKIKSIKVGDLIYDTYLREKRVSTIDIKSEEFLIFLKKAIELFLYWFDYFENNKVKGVILSHSVYLIAIPLRIACSKNISVFNAGFSSIYSMTKKKPLKFAYFNEYPKNFNKFDYKTKKKLIHNAKKNINLRLSGKKDLLYKESQSLKEKIFSGLKIKNKIKNPKNILIAAHDFTDAPHVHGNLIFNDFHDWMLYLGKKSNKIKEFNWLIKLHPAEYDENFKYVEQFLTQFPRLKLLPKDTSHNELISKGIKCVLTVYGSVGHEYPLFGIPVINAGENPHSGYKFSIYPRNYKSYNKLIDNISDIKKPTSIHQIYEYYAMYNLVDYNIFKELEFSREELNTNYIIKYFLSKYDIRAITKVEEKYLKFVKSKKRRLINFFY
tara:strand:- start:550 stop:2067 length:1518 start_codon:yes stop_codon:yes gene_type:complete